MNKKRLILYTLILLAILGVFSLIIRDPLVLIRSMLMLIVFATVVFLIFKFVFNQQTNTDEMKKYKQALKQSKRRYQNTSTKASKTKRKRPTHLRVIEGNKGKRKNDDQATN